MSRQLSQWKKIAWHCLSDDAGTATLISASLTVEEYTAALPARSFVPPQVAIRPRPATQLPIQQTPYIWAEGNLSLEYLALKRVLDIVGSLLLLVLLSPILLTVLAVLVVTTRGKPLFRQRRVGHCGRHFWMYKFRTMRLDADKLQYLVRNEKDGPIFKNRCDPRVTRLGRWLRKTSIDEMPQLANVLLGHMSLVGPRPPVPKEVAKYKPWQRRRLAIKPGLTCLWQVSGRSDIGFEDWVRMDIWYLRHQSLWTDFKLLVRTPLKVITCKGAY
ncbi:MAG TPA: sugar transferase [Pirellulales bacterium]|jgi:lipopolysaccharide/colanic/teichoic acid biosynthesis glycosyltransferase|nr:sugar transferase [Pirellulales bacterium]